MEFKTHMCVGTLPVLPIFITLLDVVAVCLQHVRAMPVPEQMRHYDECYLCSSFQYSNILVVNKAWSLLPCCAELCKSSDLLAFFCRKNAGGS